MYNIIIADDEPAVCEGLSHIIPWDEYNFQIVDTAVNGKDALQKLYLHRCNLLITDIRMPVLDGLSLIQKIRSSFPKLKILIISGYSDFSYAKQAIAQGVNGYLLKPIDRQELENYARQLQAELEHEAAQQRFIKDQSAMARNKFILDLVQGHLTQSQMSSNAEAYGEIINHDEYLLAFIELEGLYAWVEKSLEQANLIRYGILNIMEEMILLPGYGYLFENTNRSIGLLITDKTYTAQYTSVHSFLEAIQANLLNYLKIEVSIGYSDPIAKLGELPTARIQAAKALERAGFSSDSKIIRYQLVADSEHWGAAWEPRALLKAIEEVDAAQIQLELNALSRGLEEQEYTRDTIRMVLHDLMSKIFVLIKQYNGNPAKVFDRQALDIQFNQVIQLKRFQDICMDICSVASGYLIQLREGKTTTIIDQILPYINLNYHEDLNLKSIAVLFYINPAYLGQLFKQIVGVGFNDYLNKIRIEAAKTMVCQSSLMVYEIIDKTGYKNTQYFYKQFKRYEGISFAEYKEKIKGELRYS